MKRFATALTAQRAVQVSEFEDIEERELFERLGLTTALATAAVPLVIIADSEEEASQMAVSQSTQLPLKDGWYNHKACSIEIPSNTKR